MYTPIYVTQVYSGSKEDAGDGQWIPVQPVPGALTINTGDMMQVSSLLMVFVLMYHKCLCREMGF